MVDTAAVAEPEATERDDVSTQGDTPAPEHGEREEWCEECGHRFSDRVNVLNCELEKRLPPHEAIAYIDRLIDGLRRSHGGGEPNGIPKTTTTPPRLDGDYDAIRQAEVINDRIEAAETILDPYVASGWFSDNVFEIPAEDVASVCNILRVTSTLADELIGEVKSMTSDLRELHRAARTNDAEVPANGKSEPAHTNGLPAWSDSRWPEFQAFIASLPGFPKGEPFQKLTDGVEEALSDLLDDVPNWGWLRAKMDVIAEHLSSKGAAA